MEETLVSFETAKKLKEIGFINGSGHYYDMTGTPELVSNEGAIYINGLYEGYIEAPTQSLLQKYLREVHKIMTIVDFYNNGDEWEENEFRVTVSEVEYFQERDSFIMSEFPTYEGALEAGLSKSLTFVAAKQK